MIYLLISEHAQQGQGSPADFSKNERPGGSHFLTLPKPRYTDTCWNQCEYSSLPCYTRSPVLHSPEDCASSPTQLRKSPFKAAPGMSLSTSISDSLSKRAERGRYPYIPPVHCSLAVGRGQTPDVNGGPDHQ